MPVVRVSLMSNCLGLEKPPFRTPVGGNTLVGASWSEELEEEEIKRKEKRRKR